MEFCRSRRRRREYGSKDAHAQAREAERLGLGRMKYTLRKIL